MIEHYTAISRNGGDDGLKSRCQSCAGCGAAAFGAGLLVATLFPIKLILIVVAAILMLAGFSACKK